MFRSGTVNLSPAQLKATLAAQTYWDDYMIPGHSVRPSGATPPDFEAGFAGNSKLWVYNFNGVSTLEEVYFTVQIPHRWKQGSTIYPHVHFAPTSTNVGDTNSHVVRFSLEYTWANKDGAFGASSTIHLDSDPFVPNTNQWHHLIAKNSSGISGSGKVISSMMICRLYRDPADSVDTYPQDAAFLQFDIHYEIDGIGSDSQYTKS